MAASPRPNPYIFDKPLDSDTGFFGREDIIQEVERVLLYPNRVCAILDGQRYIGKTSLLLALERRLPTPPFFPIYFDLAGKGLDPVGQVLHEMAVAAAKKADMSPPEADEFEDNPDAFHESFLPALYQAIGSERQPIFLLDEFKALDTLEENLPEHVAARALDNYLFQLLTTQHYTDFIFAAGRRMSELSKVASSNFKADLTRMIPVLNWPQAKALILQKDVKGIPAYDKAAVERILALTRGHPYLTQRICHELFDRAYERSRRKPKVTLADVDALIPEMLEADDPTLTQIWKSMPIAERLILAAIAERTTQEGEALNNAVITATLNGAGISPETRGLYYAPGNLVNWQMLEQAGNSYSFYVEFMRLWVGHKHSLEQVKQEELSQGNPKAEALYQAAVKTHKAGDNEQAVDLLYKALDINPNHLPARLLLASILKKDWNQLTEAVAQYEEAYKLDPKGVVGFLVATLFLLAAALEQVRNFAGAITAYKRILALSPKNEKAKTRLAMAEKNLKEQLKRREGVRQTEARKARRDPQGKRRWLWTALIIAGILLPLLCLWALLNDQFSTSDQVAATNAAATQIAANATTAAATNQAASIPEPSATPLPTEDTALISANATATAQAAAATATAQANATATVLVNQLSGQIQVTGSDAMQDLMEELAVAFTAQHPDVEVVIQSDNPKTGLEAVKNDGADMGMVARELDTSESSEFSTLQIVTLTEDDAIALIAHPLVTVDDLSSAQVQGIFAGEITNWADVGGADAPIQVVAGAKDSDTRLVFEQSLLGKMGFIDDAGIALEAFSDQAVRDTISGLPYGFGFTTLRYATTSPEIPEDTNEVWPVLDTTLLEVKMLALDGIAPSLDNINNGSYPLTRPLNIATKNPPDAVTQGWLDFIQSAEGQQIIDRHTSTP